MFSRSWRRLGKKIYLDYAAVTPVDFRVEKVMKETLRDHWYNPSALYGMGVQAGKVLEAARIRVARILSGSSLHSIHADEIIFTSGGTEANNMAILGVVEKWHAKNSEVPHVIISAIEHPSIKKLIEHLIAKKKITASFISIEEDGIVNIAELKDIFQTQKNIALISIMLVNNEIGTIQPVSEIAGLIRKYKKENHSIYPILHTDACQAPCYLDMQIDKLGVDLLTLDGGKIYGPRGVGCLYVKRKTPIEKISFGGAQEFDMRPGTENLPAIVGFGEALNICIKEKKKEIKRLRDLQHYIFRNLPEGVLLNGGIESEKRICNNINICVTGKDSEFLLFKFDVAGIELSTGTTCQNKQEDSTSYVVDALGKKCGGSSLRISMGRGTKKSHVKKFIKVLRKILN